MRSLGSFSPVRAIGKTTRLGAAFAILGLALPAHAAVTISSSATSNMTCANGVCAPNATQAVLNVGDLENLLASGNVEVTTTGSGVQAKDIVLKAALTWSASNVLTLDAFRSITVDQPVSVQGLSGLTLTTNDGGNNGEFSFGRKGNITFANLSSSLTINGTPYTLAKTVQGLAAAVAANPAGAFALAQSWDAKQDGTYTQDPIDVQLTGTLEGLGNSISHLKLGNPATGFIFAIGSGGFVHNLALLDIKFVTRNPAGALAEVNDGIIGRCHVTGSIEITSDKAIFAGGLVMVNGGGVQYGTISDSWASTKITAGRKMIMGGLVGLNQYGLITRSYATGELADRYNNSKSGVEIGGLVGENGPDSTITSSYAIGAVIGTTGLIASAGGLVGQNDGGSISQSYSTGALENVQGYVGGLIGYDGARGAGLSNTYWDTDTSGISNPSQGAGYPENDPGITGLTTAQLQSGLPAGFDPKVWAENPTINNAFPYLIANPPRK